MILVLSPAKALDFDSPLPAVPELEYTQPDFLQDAAELIDVMRKKSPAEVASLMSLSDSLASLNVARYAAWSRPFDVTNARAAVLAFNGDVYEGLDAASLSVPALAWTQTHVRILSGLYGLLRPLDLMQAYRLEMGTRLANLRGKDLYAFWGDRIALALNQVLETNKETNNGRGELINLASAEYFKAVGAKKPNLLSGRIVTPVFQDWKAGNYKIVSFYAKRARGLMCRWAATQQAQVAEDLQGFDLEGYSFVAEASEADTWVFRRRLEG